MRRRQLTRILGLACSAGLCWLPASARAVVTFGGTGNNYTAAPGGVDNYEGQINGSFTATIVSSNFAAAANHTFGAVIEPFTFNDANTAGSAQTFNMQVAASLDDLELWQLVPGQLDTSQQHNPAVFLSSQQAPLYRGGSELGASIVDVGRGFGRGSAITGGWSWGGGQGPFSWGTNTVSALPNDNQLGTSGGFGGDFVEFPFSSTAGNPNEAVLTTFDSGGGLFVNVNGTYELDGVNTGADGVYSAPIQSAQLSGSFYDTNGYYEQNAAGNFVLQSSGSPIPQNSYATRIASKLNFVDLVDGTISKANAASAPINVDPNGQMVVYSNLTTGAITGGGSLQVGSNAVTATLQIAPNSGGSEISSLSLFNGNGRDSTLDITNNHVIIDGGSYIMLKTQITQFLQSGYNGGLWNGPGIDSSTAAASGGAYGVGFAAANDLFVPGLTSGQAEIAYTLYGDCNLDRTVNGIDFGIIAANFNKGATVGWETGDFNYDGVVNGIDFGLFAMNFNKGASGADALNAAVDSFAAANGLLQDLPEPATSGVVLCTAIGLAARPRRRGAVDLSPPAMLAAEMM